MEPSPPKPLAVSPWSLDQPPPMVDNIYFLRIHLINIYIAKISKKKKKSFWIISEALDEKADFDGGKIWVTMYEKN